MTICTRKIQNNKVQPVRGMKDLYGDLYDKYRLFVETSICFGERCGFRPISTPIVENIDVFVRSVGDTSDIVSKEIYEFCDKGGNRLCLRPEGTAAVMRAIVSEKLNQSMPLKLMYYGEMFRYDRPQKGRYRQFRQFGFEHLGDKSPYDDATLISIVLDIFKTLGISSLTLCVNSIGGLETRVKYSEEIKRIFEPKYNVLSQESQIRFHKNPLRILDSKNKNDQELCRGLPPITEYLSDNERLYFDTFLECLRDIDVNYTLDTSLVRGLDYYTDTTFEIKIDGLAVCGGGRYDNLLAEFGGPSVSGIGCAIGIERLFDYITIPKKVDKIVSVIPVENSDVKYAYKIFHEIKNMQKEFIHVGDMKKKMQKANKIGSHIVVIIGRDERINGTLCVKWMNDGRQSIIECRDLNKVINTCL